MSETITRLRDKYPAYANASDVDLIRRVGEKYPVYLDKDPGFKDEFDSVMQTWNQKSTDAVTSEDQLDQTRNSSLSEYVKASSLQPSFERSGEISQDRIESAKALSAMGEAFNAMGPAGKLRYKAEAKRLGVDVLNENEAIDNSIAAATTPLFQFSDDTKQILGGRLSGIGMLLKSGAELGVVPEPVTQAAEGVQESVGGLVEFMTTTPLGISTLGMGALPAVAQKAITGAFFVDMASKLPEQYGMLKEAVDSGDPKAIAKAAADLGLSSAFTAFAGAHLTKAPQAVSALREMDVALKDAGKFEVPEVKAEAKPSELPPILTDKQPILEGDVAKLTGVPAEQAKPTEAAVATAEFTGPGGQGVSEKQAIPRAGFRPPAESRRMEARVTLPKEYNLDKLQDQFDLFNREIGDALTTGGQFLEKEIRPDVAKGAPAEKTTATSAKINQYFVDKLITLKEAFRDAKDLVSRDAAPEYVEYFNLVEGRFMHAFRQVQELRRASHESLYFWNSVKGEMGDLAAALNHMADIKPRIPILDKLWKDLRDKNRKESGKDVLEYIRVNLFTLGSWTLDFGTNLAVMAARIPAWSVLDAGSVIAGKPAQRMASVLRAVKLNARNSVPFLSRYRMPAEVEVKLGTTIGGEMRGFGKEIMVDFSEILKDNPNAANHLKVIDRIIAAPIRAKRAVDNTFGRIGATITLYEMAHKDAFKAGLKGDAKKTFVDNYVKAPPREAVDQAVKVGKEFKFDRQLTDLEEKFTSNVLTKLVVDAYPRWGVQFTRWAGEMLGVQPALAKKILKGSASADEMIEGLFKAATGWGAIYAFDQLLYDNIDANSMEYVLENGDRVRLAGRTPLPELFFAVSLMRGDWMKAKAALPQISVPGARLLGGDPGGVLSPIVDTMRESMRGRYTAEQTSKEFTRILNDALPGKSTLGFIRAMMDPTIREGFGAPIPGIAETLPQKVNPTTGEPMAPRQRIPGTGITMPTVAGTPFPGAVRDLNDIESALLNHGIGLFRPRRTSLIELPPEDVAPELRREYEQFAGKNVKELVGALIAEPDFKELPFEVRKMALTKMLEAARTMARLSIAEKYDKSPMPAKQEPIAIQLLPEKLKQPKLDID